MNFASATAMAALMLLTDWRKTLVVTQQVVYASEKCRNVLPID